MPAQAILTQFVAALLNEFDFLLWVRDFSRVGATRRQSTDGVFQRPAGTARDSPTLLALPQLLSASKAIEENRETARDLAFLRGQGTSLGGLCPKCAVIDEYGSLAIGKFPSVSDTCSVVQGEVLALKLAAAAGSDLGELRRRMVFNILINNVDDHLNNHSFLHHARGQWALVPAFDLNPFPDKERALKIWISEASGEAASLDEALAVASQFGLTPNVASDILSGVKPWWPRGKLPHRGLA